MRIIHVGHDENMTVVSRRDSAGRVHRVHCTAEDAPTVRRWFAHDSVQKTCDGRFKIGDLVRPTRAYVENCCHGSVPYECLANWSRGFKITEIGPEGFPFKGHHHIECEGLEMLFLDTTHIERA